MVLTHPYLLYGLLLAAIPAVLVALPLGLVTVLWVIGAAVVGMWMLRLHGVATMRRMQTAIMNGELPARAMFDGALLFLSAILLIIPGFISDALAILLLLPPVRWLLLRMMIRRVVPFPQGHDPHFRRSDTLEGEFQREDERDERKYLDRN